MRNAGAVGGFAQLTCSGSCRIGAGFRAIKLFIVWFWFHTRTLLGLVGRVLHFTFERANHSGHFCSLKKLFEASRNQVAFRAATRLSHVPRSEVLQ
jgi:hypothetical protein